MNKNINPENLIARFLNGEFSSDDEYRLEEWVKENLANKRLFLETKDIWDATRQNEDHTERQLLYFYKNQLNTTPKRFLKYWVWGSSVAAVLLIGLLIGSLLPDWYKDSGNRLQSFSVPFGSRSEVVLIDGTKVKLNSGSLLILSENYSAKNRELSLTGEAYFDVTSDKKHPFTVKTDLFDIHVTGTRFNVSSYTDDSFAGATLAEGIIKIYVDNQVVCPMNPGEKITFDKKTMAVNLQKVNVKSELAWMDGDFIFREIPFPDLIKRLERWYNVKISYSGTDFDKVRYSGGFKNEETIWQVLDAIKLTSPVDYRKKDFREFELIFKPMP
ncbi:MAG: FecR family protein [Labilibaculum sp.]|nr:FecR family protein [Labilibaculum sp.]